MKLSDVQFLPKSHDPRQPWFRIALSQRWGSFVESVPECQDSFGFCDSMNHCLLESESG